MENKHKDTEEELVKVQSELDALKKTYEEPMTPRPKWSEYSDIITTDKTTREITENIVTENRQLKQSLAQVSKRVFHNC